MDGDNVQGHWELARGTFNCRTEPTSSTQNVRKRFKTGDIITVASHVGNDWCLLSEPSEVQGCYVRLRNFDGPRSWKQVKAMPTCSLGGEVPVEARSPRANMEAFWPWVGCARNGLSHSNAYRILVVVHSSDSQNRQSNLAKWLRSGRSSALVDVRHCSVVNWSKAPQEIPEAYDALVLSGGTSGNAAELESITRIDVPIFGVCRGMQLICQAFAETESQAKLEKVANSREHIVEALHVPEFHWHGKMQYHRMYGVSPARLPDSLCTLQQDVTHNTVAVVRHISRPVFGTQGHPEHRGTDAELSKQVLSTFFLVLDAHRWLRLACNSQT
mmetsp:Transcript_53371/g.95792  ORF Transcript_53371/g.95792 Transcript_53371/m.95792 type:complete len:329 (-) Transcript_53371:164-1150(-)